MEYLFLLFGTTLGAAIIFIFKNNITNKMQTISLSFASGIMFAASIWSLIIPASEMYPKEYGWLPISISILIGAIFLAIADFYLQKINKYSTNITKKLAFAITLHNIPEGMAVGIAFASVLNGAFQMEFASSMILSIGIAIQNIPEGMAISLPFKAEGLYSTKKSFLIGSLSRNS